MRKRTSKLIPAKGRLRDMADQLWSLAVRDVWGHSCAICGHRKTEAHHLTPRQHHATRYNIWNGIALCCKCHKFDKDVSPHQNAAGFMAWLETNYPRRAEWYVVNRRPRFMGTINADYYCGVIVGLRKHVPPAEFERIVGQKFSRYLLDVFSTSG